VAPGIAGSVGEGLNIMQQEKVHGQIEQLLEKAGGLGKARHHVGQSDSQRPTGGGMTHREQNQALAVRVVVTGHCGELLTPTKIDQIVTELEAEMFHGPMSWAFKPEEQD
jgi:hypothetical protein